MGKRGSANICRDPLTHHTYDGVSWTDQGEYTGDMISIGLSFFNKGKRWFDGPTSTTISTSVIFQCIMTRMGQDGCILKRRKTRMMTTFIAFNNWKRLRNEIKSRGVSTKNKKYSHKKLPPRISKIVQ